jgi:hypothetical protein
VVPRRRRCLIFGRWRWRWPGWRRRRSGIIQRRGTTAPFCFPGQRAA